MYDLIGELIAGFEPVAFWLPIANYRSFKALTALSRATMWGRKWGRKMKAARN
jgi:hypothetical protein